jgi:hypothetical protein
VRDRPSTRFLDGLDGCTGAPPNPPITELERKYCDANHAIAAPADRSRGRSGFGPTVSWDDVERQVEHYKKAR